MLNTPFSPWPCYSDEEIYAVSRVLRSNRVNYWTGEECRHFESEFAGWVGVKHAVALANGTLALDIALKALGIGAGDEVIVAPRTFIASVSCVVNAGAIPVFADVDANSGNISPATIRRVLTSRTRAIICVHLAGWPCDMEGIMALADEHGLKVVEDCAQAHGARIRGRSVGSFGHVGAWSFCQDKIMTTGGEGGMVTTDDDALWRTMWEYKDHGKSFEAVYERDHPPGFRWLHDSFGTNWRMTEMQAALGRHQLGKMPEWSAKRKKNAAAILDALRPFAGENGCIRSPAFRCNERCPAPGSCNAGCEHANYKLFVYVRPENLAHGWSREKIASTISGMGVPCFEGGICAEVYRESAFDGTPWRPEERLPAAQALGETSLMFLVHPTLQEDEISRTCEAIGTVLTKATSA